MACFVQQFVCCHAALIDEVNGVIRRHSSTLCYLFCVYHSCEEGVSVTPLFAAPCFKHFFLRKVEPFQARING